MLKDDDDVTNKEVTVTQFLWVGNHEIKKEVVSGSLITKHDYSRFFNLFHKIRFELS